MTKWRNDEILKYYVICAAVSALSWLSQFCTSKNRFRENSKFRHFVTYQITFLLTCQPHKNQNIFFNGKEIEKDSNNQKEHTKIKLLINYRLIFIILELFLKLVREESSLARVRSIYSLWAPKLLKRKMTTDIHNFKKFLMILFIISFRDSGPRQL